MITKLGKSLSQSGGDDSTSVVGAAAGLAGAGVLRNALASGDLTGRRTLYHGTTEDVARSIRQQGLLPTTDANAVNTKIISHDTDRYAKSLGKAYATPSKAEALGYAVATRNRRAGNFLFMDPARLSDFKGVVKLNVPEWKHNMVMNPEVDMDLKSYIARSAELRGKQLSPVEKQQAASAYRQLRRAAVFDGGVSPEYVKGADKYKANSIRELLEYARARPGQFARGLGKGAIGLAGIAGSGYLLGKNLGLIGGNTVDMKKQANKIDNAPGNMLSEVIDTAGPGFGALGAYTGAKILHNTVHGGALTGRRTMYAQNRPGGGVVLFDSPKDVAAAAGAQGNLKARKVNVPLWRNLTRGADVEVPLSARSLEARKVYWFRLDLTVSSVLMVNCPFS